MISSVLKIVWTRPTRLWSYARGYSLFWVARVFRWLAFPRGGVRFGNNVRVQKNSSILCEPGAEISLGDHTIIYEFAKTQAHGAGSIHIGEYCILGDVQIYSRHGIRIGKRLLTSWNVLIQDYDPHPTSATQRGRHVEAMCLKFKPQFGATPPIPADDWNFPGASIEIGDDVWLGANCAIFKGAKIGSGCVVAAGAVVTAGEYEAGSLIGGIPAKVIRKLEP